VCSTTGRWGFADYRGNRQYITIGNLAENDRAALLLIDYTSGQRIKVWGRARVVEDADVVARLVPPSYNATPERAILFEIEAWDANCPRHIPRLVSAPDAAATVARLEARIKELEAELSRAAAANAR
jgi:predicted pyridoxine 5'-phosphate oxidase superfamily flavin-nucleotide-binding protein